MICFCFFCWGGDFYLGNWDLFRVLEITLFQYFICKELKLFVYSLLNQLALLSLSLIGCSK